MREIKFRAWDTKAKKMFFVTRMSFRTNHDVFRLWDETEDFHIENPEDCILMQYTGLLDKNGKEIYEGDILYIYPGFGCEWTRRTVVVEYQGASFWIWIRHGDGSGGGFILDDHDASYEVIGNIYENPGLLK